MTQKLELTDAMHLELLNNPTAAQEIANDAIKRAIEEDGLSWQVAVDLYGFRPEG